MVEIPTADPVKRVLVIDGSKAHREVLCHLIQGQGLTAVSAASGREGIASALALKPDLILLDVILEDLDGFEVLKGLKAHPDIRTVPVIVLSTRIDEASRNLAFSIGACAAIAKPYDIAYTLDHIRDILDRAHACRADAPP